MRTCIRCGSFAINPHRHGREPNKRLNLCDVCYWRQSAEELEFLILSLEALDMDKRELRGHQCLAKQWLLSLQDRLRVYRKKKGESRPRRRNR